MPGFQIWCGAGLGIELGVERRGFLIPNCDLCLFVFRIYCFQPLFTNLPSWYGLREALSAPSSDLSSRVSPQDIMGMLLAVNAAVRGLKMPAAAAPAGSAAVRRLAELLDRMAAWVDDIPPVEQPQRFGNKAFRTFFQRLEEVCGQWSGPALRDFDWRRRGRWPY